LQTLGVVRRAQVTFADTTGAAANTYIAGADTSAAVPDPAWTSLGLADSGVGASFNYVCTAGVDATAAAGNPVAGAVGTCTASRAATPANTITISNSIGTFACGGAYVAAAVAPNRTGCVGA
jgi:hypothetical protein